MAYYYKVDESVAENQSVLEGIQVYPGSSSQDTKYDFSKHVLIELLDNSTPEAKLWGELKIADSKIVTHKRLVVDPHRKNCRRAVVVCIDSDEAKLLAQRLNQTTIVRRCICAVVVEELLSDIRLFENQIIEYGDKRSQQQLVYVTDLRKGQEPAELAQYLRAKFSPFGTILSVLVSQDKNNFAYPEGVIRFKHLSEAFAAEICYDQCAVAMERLSVTTHHNILLCQCDLRARLKEARLRHANETMISKSDFDQHFNSSSMSPNADLMDLEETLHHTSSSENSKIEENVLYPSSSAEIANAMEDDFQSNLMGCLRSIAGVASENSTVISDDNGSLCSTLKGSQDLSNQSLHQSDSIPIPQPDKTWSSRIHGWLSDVQNVKPEEINSEASLMNAVENHHATSGANSTVCSFTTCRNEDEEINTNGTANYKLSSLQSKNNFHNKEPSEVSTPVDSPTEKAATEISAHGFVSSTPNKRKNSSMMTRKLSVKSQKLQRSQMSNCDTTLKIPASFKSKRCSVILSSMPELDSMVQALNITSSTLKELDISPTLNAANNVRVHSGENGTLLGRSIESTYVENSSIKSTQSQPPLKKGRARSKNSGAFSTFSEPVTGKANKSTIHVTNEKKHFLGDTEDESPLLAWLKNELTLSTNNRLTSCEESAKSIVCATANKDVLISVGCSHMTCNTCYPDSTKLLLGFL